MSEVLRERALVSLAVLGIGGLSLVACGEDIAPDNSPAKDFEQRLMEESDPLVLSPGDVGIVPEIPSSLNDEYEKLHRVKREKTDSFNKQTNRDNVLTFKPNRYETDFDRGEGDDGDQPDAVCEDLRVTEDTKYVLAVQDSEEDVWMVYEEDGSEVHICFNSTSDRPDDVAVWGSNESR